MSLEGAHRLAAKIRSYWKSRGQDVTTRIEEVRAKIEDSDEHLARLFVVRSDMVGGMAAE
jgi:hypothetical protein